jgi:methylenetetrahydrofolate reductase (NADPH)
MRLDEHFAARPTISFEFFPAQERGGLTSLYHTIEHLKPLRPSYVSVTYGAGGSTRSKTIELCGKIQNEIGIDVMAHLTCVGPHRRGDRRHPRSAVRGERENVLALRGDPPTGGPWVKTPGGFEHADELVPTSVARRLLRRLRRLPRRAPAVPEPAPRPRAPQGKVDAGAQAIVTQLFFDNADFLRFRDDCRHVGINVPIVAASCRSETSRRSSGS